MLLIDRNTSLQNQDSEPSLRYSDSLNTELLVLRLDAYTFIMWLEPQLIGCWWIAKGYNFEEKHFNSVSFLNWRWLL